MPSSEPAVRRALEGLGERSGRTVVVLGPPGSGKSALLEELAAGVEAAGGRTVRLKGSYRDRAVPFGALQGLDRAVPAPEEGELPADDEPSPEDGTLAPMAPVAIDPESISATRRRDGRIRTTIFGGPARLPGPPVRDADEFWLQLLPEFEGDDAHPVAVLADDAVLFDAESREFLVALSQRARYRALLVAVVLESTSSAAGVWEEVLLGRTDVDWVRLTSPMQDPREVHRLRELMDGLPAPAVRALAYVTLLGGEANAVILARIARIHLRQLPETLRPAVELGLLRVREAKVFVPDRSSVPILEGLLPEAERPRWHLDVAEGLQALSSEPPLSRRIEVARHYLASAPDAAAMSRLLETAEISLGLLEFDEATRLLAEAIRCLGAIPPSERAAVEPEMRLLNARALYGSGCAAEAETQLREGVDGALRAATSQTDLASWLEPLLPTLQAVGPRRQLMTLVVELADRLHDAGLLEPEVLLETLLPGFDVERNLAERSRTDALRAAQNAHRMRERHLQALGLLAMGVSRLAGSAEEMQQAERFLRAARFLLRDTRRWELDYLAAEFECRLLETRGSVDQSLAVRQQNVVALERARLPSLELYHVLAIAQVYLDRDATSRADAPLDRAIRLVDHLHLLPPSPGLLRTWLLDGRRHAIAGTLDAARDRWSAIVDLPATLTLPRIRAEAMLRLALLEQATGRREVAERLAEQLARDDVASVLPEAWKPWSSDLGGRAGASRHGGGPLPAAPPPAPPKLGRRERRRR